MKIIHQDLKPANILLNEKQAGLKLIDFGLSVQLENDDDETKCRGQTYRYSSPEQL